MPIAPAQIENVWLSKVDFSTNPGFDRSEAIQWIFTTVSEAQMEPLQRTDAAADGEQSGEEGADDRISWSTVRLAVHIEWARIDGDEPQEDEDGDAPLQIALEVTGVFVWRGDAIPDDRIGNLWLEYNAQYLLWPYLRQYIATITAMSNVPTLTIGTMNVPELPQIGDDSAENVLEDVESADADSPATHET
jgi:hypothetical protein